MKKVLALVLSVLMVLSLSVVAFAEDGSTPSDTNTTPGQAGVDSDTNKKFELGFGDLGKEEDATPDKPGATYYYTIMDNNEETSENGMLVDPEIAKHLTVSIKESGDKMIDSYSIVKQNGVYKVKVVTKETYTTDKTKATWTITLKKDKKYKVAEAEVEIAQKWAEICDKNIEKDTYGEYVFDVDLADAHDGNEGASYPNYTDDKNVEALAVIPKDAKYAELYFDGTEFWYSVKNSAKTTANVYFETSNKKMSTIYEDADLEMIFFKGTPEFDYTGVMHAPYDKDAFVYAVIGGKLVEDKFTWNKEAECWEMNAKKIEGVVVSDIKLDVSKYNSTIGGKDNNKNNPGTGSVDFVNVAVALGVVSLAAAGAVALKK